MRTIAAALTALLFAAALPAGCGGKEEKNDRFDETEIVLSFSAMSDIHQQKDKTAYADKLLNALDYAEELNGGPLDVALFAGDLTEETWRQNNEDYSAEYNADVEMLKTTLEQGLDLDETGVFYSLGNHDTDPSVLGEEIMAGKPELFYNQLGEEFFRIDADDSRPEDGLRHAVVNGYHFLAVKPDYYWTLRGYSEETLQWLNARMSEITSENPGQYVFVTAHPPVYGTVFRSYANDWADRDVADVLAKYPQAVYFSGHVHNVLQDEVQISQNGGFTQLDCGSVKYTAMMNNINDAGATFDNSVGTRIDDFSQGLLVQVDANGNIRITRCDYYRRNTIKQAWELSYPKADKTHLLAYDNERLQRENKAPEFAEDAVFSASLSGNTICLQWSAAEDDDMVRYYRVAVYQVADEKKTKLGTYNLATFTYLYDQVEEMPKTVSYERETEYSGELFFECRAVDVWGATSEPIETVLEI